MNDMERDKWEDEVRSKLFDFESDTLPGDWEAIADRLPSRVSVPLRRKLGYWAAAAVISLLVVSGGIYLSSDVKSPVTADGAPAATGLEPAEEPVAAAPLAAAEKPSGEMAADKAPVRAVARSGERVRRPVARTASPLRMAGAMPRVPRAERSALLPADVRPVAVAATGKPSLAIASADLRVAAKAGAAEGLTGKGKPAKRSRKWGFGMGGGGLSMGANNLVPQYVTNSSLLKSESLDNLNAFETVDKVPAETDIDHKTPISFGVAVSRYLNDRFSIETGLTYSYLRSEWSTNNTYHIENDQRLHFIGIPLSLTYKIAEWNRFRLYASAGAMAEVNVAGKRQTEFFSDDVRLSKLSERVRMHEWLWSVNARAGVSYPVVRFVSAFAEVGGSYYFDNGSAVKTIHSEKPFNVSLQLGFRLGF